MAITVYLAAATLDGFIADADDGVDWLFEDDIDWLVGFDPERDIGDRIPLDLADGFLEGVGSPRVGSVIMGSGTYESLLDDPWPYGDRPVWVLTSRDLAVPERADVRFHGGSAAEAHADAAAAAGEGSVWLAGGGGVASDLLDAGLIDEVQLTVVPILLGSGKRLFDRPLQRRMRLAGTHTLGSGLAHLSYATG